MKADGCSRDGERRWHKGHLGCLGFGALRTAQLTLSSAGLNEDTVVGRGEMGRDNTEARVCEAGFMDPWAAGQWLKWEQERAMKELLRSPSLTILVIPDILTRQCWGLRRGRREHLGVCGGL